MIAHQHQNEGSLTEAQRDFLEHAKPNDTIVIVTHDLPAFPPAREQMGIRRLASRLEAIAPCFYLIKRRS